MSGITFNNITHSAFSLWQCLAFIFGLVIVVGVFRSDIKDEILEKLKSGRKKRMTPTADEERAVAILERIRITIGRRWLLVRGCAWFGRRGGYVTSDELRAALKSEGIAYPEDYVDFARWFKAIEAKVKSQDR